MLPTSKEYLYCFYGTLIAGGIPVPLYPPARLSTIEDHLTRHVGILKSCGAAIMVTIPEAKPIAWLLRAQVESLRAVLMPADFPEKESFTPVKATSGQTGFLQYTSGSTGQPKGVVLTHANLLANARWARRRARPADVFVSWLPLYHDMGLIGGCFATMYLSFPVVLMSPLAFLARPSSWLRAIHRHRGTISGGPNFSYELCLRRIPEHELGRPVELALRLQRRRAGEPGNHDRLQPEILQIRLQPQLDVAGVRPRRMLGRLAFTPPGEPWQVDLLDREIFSSSSGRRLGARGRSRAAQGGAAGARSRTTSCAWSTPPASSCPTARKARCSSAAVGDQRLLPQSRKRPRACSTASG